MTSTNNKKEIRLARLADYPAEHLIALPTSIQTGNNFSNSFDIAEQVLGKDVPQGSLFAYLFRRFGNPNKGSDPYKELAAYLLTTTRSDMLLKIVPYSGGNTSLSFVFLVTHETRAKCDRWVSRARSAHYEDFVNWIERENLVPKWAEETAEEMTKQFWPVMDGVTGWRRMMPGLAMLAFTSVKNDDHEDEDKVLAINWYKAIKNQYDTIFPIPPVQWRSDDIGSWENDDPMKPYAQAMVKTLEDLLRPVCIRDTLIGIYGKIDESKPEALGNRGKEADYAHSSGYPSGDLGNIDPEAFHELQSAILELDTNPESAIARAIKIISSHVEQ